LTNADRINPKTKELILQTAEQYNYRPDLLARGLVKGQTYYLGVVVLDVNNRYFSQMLSAIESTARKRGYFVNITLHENDKDMEKEQIARLADYHVDGIILSSVNQGEEYKKFLEELDIPLVSIDNKIADGIPFVGIDGRKAVYEATKVIIEKGYQKVVFVCPPLSSRKIENVYVHEERAAGYEAAMAEYPDAIKKIIPDWNFTEIAQTELNKEDDVRTAFLCSGDMFALELMKYLDTKGLSTPKDYGIMGFDNIDTLQYVKPRLSTIYNSVEEVANTAVDLLFGIMSGEETEKIRILGYETILGETL
jgi:LacI family transcriptional regulator